MRSISALLRSTAVLGGELILPRSKWTSVLVQRLTVENGRAFGAAGVWLHGPYMSTSAAFALVRLRVILDDASGHEGGENLR